MGGTFDMEDWKTRFNKVIELVESFIGKQDPVENQESGQKLPEPLALFYRYFGDRINDIVTYNNFIPSGDLNYTNEHVIFYVHEGETCSWATYRERNDFRVIKIDEDQHVIQEKNDLTDFLFQICIYELCLRLTYNMMFFGKPDAVKEIADSWNEYPFARRRNRDQFPNEFYYKNGTIGFVWYGDEGCTFYCGGKTNDKLGFMKSYTESKGLKDDKVHTDLNQRLENGYWDFYINGEPCQEKEFWIPGVIE